MVAKRKGLGKGLDSLIPAKNDAGANTVQNTEQKIESKITVNDKNGEEKNGETFLKINQVEPNRDQPRKEFGDSWR